MSHAILTAILVTSVYPSCDPNATPYLQEDVFRPAAMVVYPSPCYDCYSRHRLELGCYPTFYQRYYRRPYNYRNMIDYPWHADVYRPGCGEFGQPLESTAVRADDSGVHRPRLDDPRIQRLGASAGGGK